MSNYRDQIREELAMGNRLLHLARLDAREAQGRCDAARLALHVTEVRARKMGMSKDVTDIRERIQGENNG